MNNEQQTTTDRETLRMRLFVEVYIKSMFLNRIDPRHEALKAIEAFDLTFPVSTKTKPKAMA